MRVITRAPAKINRSIVENAWRQRSLDQRLIVRDKDCRGLALIVNPTAMTGIFAYRPRGTDPNTGKRWPNKTVTIGNPATHSPDDARHEANRIKGQVAAGADPAAERKAAVADRQRRRGTTLNLLVEGYAKVLPQRPKLRGSGLPSQAYVAEELAQVRLAAAEMQAGDRPVAELGEADIRRLLTNAHGTARKRYGAFSRFLDWCQDEGHIAANPCALVARARRPKPLQARSRYLPLPELARLWRASEELREPVWRDLSRFLIAVPCRRKEAATLDWSHVDLAAAEWHQPSKLTKNREPHRLYLHPLALDILRQRHEAAGRPATGLVFPAPQAGSVFTAWSKLKRTVNVAFGRSAWTWHDHRRSFASTLAEHGVPETVADAILNHRQAVTRGGVLGIYQRASRWPEQVQAMRLWGKILAALLTGG